ncbi:hypothetical protein ACHAPT_012985 [Fusarium lateritium]
MAKLLALPEETLVGILMCDSDASTLLALTQVSRRLRSIASPILVQRWPYNRERLLWYLLHHPELRTHVKKLTLDGITTLCEYQDAPPDNLPSCELSTRSLEALGIAAEETWPALAESTSWTAQIRKGITDALYTLLLCWATRLFSLDLDLPFVNPLQRDHALILQLVSNVARRWNKTGSTGLPLLELRSVALWHSDTDLTTDGRHAAPFFHLPNMKSFTGRKIGLNDLTNDQIEEYYDPIHGWSFKADPRVNSLLEFPVGTSPIEELILEQVDASVEALSTLVRACRRLKMLVYQPGPVCNNNYLGLKGLAKAVLHHRKSLEKLVIDFSLAHAIMFYDHDNPDAVPGNGGGEGDNGRGEGRDIGSVVLKDCYQHLECLRSLAIPVSHLYRRPDSDMMPSRLPASLVHLRLEGSNLVSRWKESSERAESYISDLVRLLWECELGGHLPNLRQINLVETLPKDFAFEGLDKLVELAKARNVKLVFMGRWEEHQAGIKRY